MTADLLEHAGAPVIAGQEAVDMVVPEVVDPVPPAAGVAQHLFREGDMGKAATQAQGLPGLAVALPDGDKAREALADAGIGPGSGR